MTRRHRFLLLYSDVGGAHRAIVEALHESLLPAGSVRAVDLFSTMSAVCRALVRPYPALLLHGVGLYNAVYGAAARPELANWLHRGLLRPALVEGTAALLRREAPTCVVSLFPFLPRVVAEAIGRTGGGLRPAHVVVPADLFTIHPAWAEPSADLTLATSREAVRRLQLCGVPAERVRLTRYPVRTRFGPGRIGASRSNGSRTGPHPIEPGARVLVMGGGDGIVRMPEICRAILALNEIREVVAVPGRNMAHRRSLELLTRRYPGRLQVTRAWNEVPRLMANADLVVTKPGPSTIMEAVQIGVPILLTSPVPAQENGNVRYVLEQGIGRFATRDAVSATARDMLEPIRRAALGERLRQARRALPRRSAAERILEFLSDRMTP